MSVFSHKKITSASNIGNFARYLCPEKEVAATKGIDNYYFNVATENGELRINQLELASGLSIAGSELSASDLVSLYLGLDPKTGRSFLPAARRAQIDRQVDRDSITTTSVSESELLEKAAAAARDFENNITSDASTISFQTLSKSEQKKAGFIVDFGAAPYQFDDTKKENYFVALSDTKDGEAKEYVWGKELAQLTEKGEIKLGDCVHLFKTGSEGVTVSDDNKPTEMIAATKFNWAHECIDPASMHSENKTNTVLAYSTTFAVDKSISAFYAISDDTIKAQINKAMMQSSEKLIDFLVCNGYFTARAKEGNVFKEFEGEPTVATFLHHLTRPTNGIPDPHLHVHMEIMNYLKCHDGQVRTLDWKKWMSDQKAIGAYFDMILHDQLSSVNEMAPYLNRDVEKSGLKIEGFTKEAIESISNRNKAIKADAAEKGLASAQALNISQMKTKSSKEDITDANNVLTEWKSRISHDKELAKEASYYAGLSNLKLEALLFKGCSLIKDADLKTIAARLTIGSGGADAFANTYRHLKEVMGIVSLGFAENKTFKQEIFTTQEMIALECDILNITTELAQRHKYCLDAVLVEKAIAKAETLLNAKNKTTDRWEITDEQKSAARTACTAGDLVVIEGRAGTGKTTGSLLATTLAYQSAGLEILGCAPSGVAAKGLKDEIKAPCGTIHKMLTAHEKGRLSFANKVVVVDEAGMIDTRTLHCLASKIKADGGKVILTGDSKQLEAVGSASMLRLIKQQAGKPNTADINLIIRQKNKELLKVVNEIYRDDGGISYINVLRHNNMMHDGRADYFGVTKKLTQQLATVGFSGAAPEKIYADFVQRSAKKNELSAANFKAAFFENLPEKLKKSFNKNTAAQELISLHFETTKKEEAKYAPAEKMAEFLSQKHQSHGAELWSGRNNLILCDKNDDVDHFNQVTHDQRKSAGEITDCQLINIVDKRSGEVVPKEFGIGDRIMFLKNKGEQLSNGQIGHITNISGRNFYVKNDEGEQKISLDEYQYINHAYAMTVHKSQGVTCDNVFYLATETTNRLQTLVGITRARYESHVFTNSDAFCEENNIATFAEKTAVFEWKKTATEMLQAKQNAGIPRDQWQNLAISPTETSYHRDQIRKYSVQEAITKETNYKLFDPSFRENVSNKGYAAAAAQQKQGYSDHHIQRERDLSLQKMENIKQLAQSLAKNKKQQQEKQIKQHPLYIDLSVNQPIKKRKRSQGQRI